MAGGHSAPGTEADRGVSDNTYPAPAHGWVCFHCGERFITPNAARDHFGHTPTAEPACRVSAAHLREELREYRALEARFGRLDPRNRAILERYLERREAP